MKKAVGLLLCTIMFCLLFCGCFDDGHYYNYDYDSIVKYLNNCASYDVDEYFYTHYSKYDLIEMLGKDAIMDHVIGMGWMDECIEEYYGKDDFQAGYSVGYESGYSVGFNDGYEAGLKDGKEN